jgi:hypothetical protein
MSDVPQMLELRGVPDVFVSGLGSVEDLGGGNFRFTFFANQDVLGRRELVVAAKLIMSIEAVPAAMHLTGKKTHACVCENARGMVRN